MKAMPSKDVLFIAFAIGLLLPSCSKHNDEPSVATNNQSDAKGLFLFWQHPTSRRHAIVEEDGRMIWLYLTVPDGMKPERDSPVYTTAPPAESVDWKQIQKTGEPPPITKDVASPTALLEHPVASEFSVVWSADGRSVGVIRSN
jgi:hypothetical protein